MPSNWKAPMSRVTVLIPDQCSHWGTNILLLTASIEDIRTSGRTSARLQTLYVVIKKVQEHLLYQW